jgi:uncharacterized protein (DUF2147 family)
MRMSGLKIFFIALFFILFNSIYALAQVPVNKLLVGTWKCTTYDVTVYAFENGGKVYANLLSFPCSHKPKMPLSAHKDEHNPNKALRTRNMLGIQVLSNLVFEGKNKWVNGTVYVPATGQTFSVYIKLLSTNQIIIHGFIGFEFFGKSLLFNKVG